MISNPSNLETVSRIPDFGDANSTNSNPYRPIGFSNDPLNYLTLFSPFMDFTYLFMHDAKRHLWIAQTLPKLTKPNRASNWHEPEQFLFDPIPQASPI